MGKSEKVFPFFIARNYSVTFLPLYIYFIAVSFFASIFVFQKLKDTFPYLRMFPFFLFFTLLVEILGSYFSSVRINNVVLYNFFTVFEFCFYLFIINLIIGNRNVKKIIHLSIIVYAIAAIVNILFIQKSDFHTVTYSLGCLLVVIFCIYYFLELFKLPRSVNLVLNPAFWICSGLLFFYCCGFPLWSLINYWNNISPLVLKNFDRIITILNIFLYSLFTIAFLCVRTRNYTSS
jgi:hypothetical protein